MVLRVERIKSKEEKSKIENVPSAEARLLMSEPKEGRSRERWLKHNVMGKKQMNRQLALNNTQMNTQETNNPTNTGSKGNLICEESAHQNKTGSK